MKKLYLAVIASNFCMLSNGICFAWALPSLFTLLQVNNSVHLTPVLLVFTILCYYIGGIVGSLSCIWLLDTIGRKWSLLVAMVTGMVGWIMVALATSAQVLTIGRYMLGLSTSYGYISSFIYVAEISPANVRGILTSTLIVAANIGVFIKWTLSPYLSVITLAIVLTFPPIFFFCSISWLPESPYFLMLRGKHRQAIESLMLLRESMDVFAEVDIIEKSVKTDLANNIGLRELFSVSGNRKALITVLSLMVIQQWSGLIILSNIFIATCNLKGIILGTVQIISIALATFVMDCYGRRPLLIISSLGTSVSTFLIGLFFFLRNNQMDVTGMTLIPTTGAILYVIMTLPFTMMSEVFPTTIKPLASGISMLSRDFNMAILEVSFPLITFGYGIHAVSWLFSTVSLLGAVFVYFYVPETKGKTLQEVQDLLHKRTSL